MLTLGFKITVFSLVAIVVSAVLFLFFYGQKSGGSIMNTKHQSIKSTMRPAAVAGQFYPDNSKALQQMVDSFLNQATSVSTSVPQIIIVPHAGYVYSGQVAAFGFRALQNSGYKRIILIGRSHQEYFDKVAADGNDVWQTPLGDLTVDKDFIDKLISSDSVVQINSEVHEGEHSLEVMLPFLIQTLGREIKIVPLLFGNDSSTTSFVLAEKIAPFIDKETVVVISTDLSHYPKYEDANYLDKQTIEAILTGESSKFIQKVRELEQLGKPNVATLACAEPAVVFGLALAKRLGLKAQLLKYANCGDYFAETKNRVVGYTAIGFYPENEAGALSVQEQEMALQIARKTLADAFDQKNYEPESQAPIFKEKRGVFVTLKKHEQLRGCIGNFNPPIGLAKNIQEMALSAAFNDPRFTPLEKSELKDLEIEISVLSPMQKTTDPNIIKVGKHGVYVKKGLRSGVFLPQVAIEQGWDREEFLDNLCEGKAGLPRTCWQDGSCDLYIFTAQVFHE
ncbi:MAG: AmmeMemoRadiSam system protein B [Candidatus Pacebacteria bacterium]|nr:AmmeMemoRadiSam system protein B [Candidatus Paceibacterota bacterium]